VSGAPEADEKRPPVDRRYDIAFGVAQLALAAGALWLARDFPADSRQWPMAAAGVLVLGTLGALVQLLAGRADLADEPPMAHPARAVAVFALFLGFLAVTATVGFITAGVLLTLAIPPVLGERRPVVVLSASAIFMAATWFVFTQVFHRVMPTDWFLGG